MLIRTNDDIYEHKSRELRYPHQNILNNFITEKNYKINLESRLIEIINTKGYAADKEVLLITREMNLFDELKIRRLLNQILYENNLIKLKVNCLIEKNKNKIINYSRYIIIRGFQDEILKKCA